LKEKGLTLSVAESVTGGLICSRLVNVPGMSQCLLEGQISYTNQAKIRQLNIQPDRLQKYGPVSPEIASDMAYGSASVSGADIGLSVTGWAGPADDPKGQTGLIWMGMYINSESSVKKIIFSGDRNQIRFFAANMALCWLLNILKDRR
jgi:nicotinamide-nucleotide amidase